MVEVESGKEVASGRPEHQPGDISLSPDGAALAVARKFRAEIDLWDVKAGKILRTYRGHTGWLNAVAYAPDGKSLATCAWDRTIRFWDPQNDPIARRPTTVRTIIYASEAAFRPDGKEVAIVQGDNVASLLGAVRDISLVDAETGKVSRTISRAHDSPRRVAYSADGRVLVSGGRDGKARAWEIPSGAPLGTFQHESWITAVAASRDGRWVASAPESKVFTAMRMTGRFTNQEFRGELAVWDARSGAVRREFKDLPGQVDRAQFHPTEDLLAASFGSVVRLWDLATGKPRWKDTYALSSDALAFSADGSLIAAVGGPSITLIDAGTGEVRARSSSGEGTAPFGGLAFSPDGRRLAAARGQEVKLWEVPSGGEILTLPRPAAVGDAGPSPLAALAFSPDGLRLLNADRSGLIEVWDAGPPGDRK